MSLSFSELEEELRHAPATWVPALLRALIARAIVKQVFKPGGAVVFVQGVLEKLNAR